MLGLVIVIVSMLILFTVPRDYFVAATFASTTCMLIGAYGLGGLRVSRPKPASIVLGFATAALLYAVFTAGASAVAVLHPFGVTPASEASIYALISSPSGPPQLQVAVLLFDSAGYESFFRGVLQSKLRPRMGVAAAPAVALFDAALHIATLNPLWVGATFVADLIWGLTYHYGRGTQASFTSHLVWDIAIFILRPVT